jgi:hypothetical protein
MCSYAGSFRSFWHHSGLKSLMHSSRAVDVGSSVFSKAFCLEFDLDIFDARVGSYGSYSQLRCKIYRIISGDCFSWSDRSRQWTHAKLNEDEQRRQLLSLPVLPPPSMGDITCRIRHIEKANRQNCMQRRTQIYVSSNQVPMPPLHLSRTTGSSTEREERKLQRPLLTSSSLSRLPVSWETLPDISLRKSSALASCIF